MGEWIQNIYLKGPSQEQAADAARQVSVRRSWVVTAQHNGWIALYGWAGDTVEGLDEAIVELCRRCSCVSMYACVADGDFLILNVIGPNGEALHHYCSKPADWFADGSKVSLEEARRDWPYARDINAPLLAGLAKAGTTEADIRRAAAIEYATDQLHQLGDALGICNAGYDFSYALNPLNTEPAAKPYIVIDNRSTG